MLDDSISPVTEDAPSSKEELPVMLDSLEVDGTRPSVGDKVELKVSGTVKKVVNDTAIITPEEVNGTPLADIPAEESSEAEKPDLRAMSEAADVQNPGY